VSEPTPSPETPLLVATAWPRPDVCLVRLVGELDMSTAPLVRDRLAEQTAARPAYLVLDLAAVELIAAAGISLLITALRNEHGIHGRLHVVGPAEGTALRTLRLTGVEALLQIHDSVDAALAAMDAVRRD
jgi:anti-sigma B factor antagonist